MQSERIVGAGATGSLGSRIVAALPGGGRARLDHAAIPRDAVPAQHFAGGGVLDPLDNARYPELRWTPIRQVLAAYQSRRN